MLGNNVIPLLKELVTNTNNLPNIEKRLAELTTAVNELTRQVEKYRKFQQPDIYHGASSPDLDFPPRPTTLPRPVST